MEYILGIDAGGTKTASTLYDENQKQICTHLCGMGNMVVDRNDALSNIAQAIGECTKNLSLKAKVHVYIGAAGITAGDNTKVMDEYLLGKYPNYNITILSDGHLALYAGLKDNDGIVISAGTGSIGYGMCEGEIIRVGGLGHLIGDEGSGYMIGISAIRDIYSHHDENREFSPLNNAIFDKLKTRDIYSIEGFVYSKDKSSIASLAHTVSDMAIKGDKQAIDLLKKTGEDINHLIDTIYNRQAYKDEFKIVMRGSIGTKIDIINEHIRAHVSKKYIKATIKFDKTSATLGAYYIHRRSK